MANQTVGELNVTMNLEITKLQGQIDAANKRIAAMAKKAHGDVASMAKNMNAALATIGASISASAIIAFGKSVIDLGGQIVDTAAEAGMGTDAFQTLAISAADSGVSMEQLAQASTRLRQAMQGAKEGNQQFTDAFSKLGLDARALQALAPERQFEVLGNKIANAADQQKAFTAALDILGAKGGPKLLAFLKELGTEGFDKLSDDLKNVRLTPEQLKTLDDAGDKLARMWTYAKLIGAKGVLAAADSVQQMGAPSGAYPGPNFGMMPVGADLAASQIAAYRADHPVTQATEFSDKDVIATAEAKEKQNAAIAEYNRLKAEQDRLDKSAAETAKTLGDIEARNAAQAHADLKGTEDTNKAIDDYLKLLKDTQTPMEAYIEQLKELEDMEKRLVAAGLPAAQVHEAIARAMEHAGDAMQEARKSAVTDELDRFFDSLDDHAEALHKVTGYEKLWAEETMRIAGNAADNMTDAWVDAINGVEGAFGNLGKVVAREIEAMIVKMLIVVPTMQAIGTAMKSMGMSTGVGSLAGAFLNYGGGHASGGAVEAGTTYLVGEKGPELFTATSSGNITPNNKLASLTGAKSGDTYSFSYNIPAGVTRADLIPALEETKRATIATIQDMRRRGKA